MFSKDIQNWISLSAYDESSDIISFIFWHTLTRSDLFLGGKFQHFSDKEKRSCESFKGIFWGKMAQSHNIFEEEKNTEFARFQP
jgi:hypothetical protein